MKNLLLVLFLSCCVFCSFAEEKNEIPLKKVPEPTTGQRTPFSSDITAYYQSGVIYLNFGGDMGEVEITVTNETTGEQWSQTGDTAFGAATISISTNAGDYSIMITTGDSYCYSGYFSL